MCYEAEDGDVPRAFVEKAVGAALKMVAGRGKKPN